jgi:hypothetical protein
MIDSVASLYSTTWLNIFALNPSIKAPDRIVPRGQLINIGHIYAVVPGDSLSKIAARFGSSIQVLTLLALLVQKYYLLYWYKGTDSEVAARFGSSIQVLTLLAVRIQKYKY